MSRRIEDVETPIVGKRYLVPTVLATLCKVRDRIPVLGPLHDDAEYIGFPDPHFHIDTRFVSERLWRRLRERAFATVIVEYVGPVVHVRRTCKRETPGYPFQAVDWLYALQEAYAGRRLSGRTKVCPHRGASLLGQPVRNGCTTCPLHGLRFDHATGVACDPSALTPLRSPRSPR